MRDSVSIRNNKTSTAHSASLLGKSRASAEAELARLLPLWPQQINDRSIEGRKRLIAAIERALREERRRGREGNRAYDLARHAALYQMLKHERVALTEMKTTEIRLRNLAQR